MPELQNRLQEAVGDAYRVEQELGGGGMSRVFLAEDVELGRRVVIKVLPPEMGAGVSVERFRREIQLAASLQHPHIVPLLSAGSQDDLLYYMMPFIEGESLRAKLAREGELPIGEAVRIMKEVVDALAYAHEHGVVHRDIKPDNILLSGKHAVVTDFGVAKAVSASTGESSLTSLGVALGTPAYMAPEQATADPHVDHRADIYAVGAMAYEMLTGRPPFSGPNPQAVLSAHVTEAPEPATKHRTTVPESLNALLMRCLEKKAADRWQRSDEMLPHLDAILTPSGGITPTGTQPVPTVDHSARARQAHPVRVAVLFGLASAVVLLLVYFIVRLLGLPDWVLVGAGILLVIGLPIIMLTGHHERQRALAHSIGGAVETPKGLRRVFTWRRSLLGGVFALGGLGAATAVFMATRALGIGPAATLLSADVLEEGDVVVLADFENHTSDSQLAATVTEAVRIDLSQSPAVQLMAPDDLTEALERMEHEWSGRLEADVARQVAIREGAKAVITGDINAAGGGYVLSAQMIASDDGRTLTGVREAAKDASEIIPAIDRLSKGLREQIGESLRSIRASPGLSRVTTASLEALQSYTEGLRIYWSELDLEKTLPFLERATEIDTSFASAYGYIAAFLFNRGRDPAKRDAAMTRAYELRDRLTDRERLDIASKYQMIVVGDRDEGTKAFEAYYQRFPDDGRARHNLGVAYGFTRRFGQAEQLYRQNLEVNPGAFQTNENLTEALMNQGKVDDAAAHVVLFEQMFPELPAPVYQHAHLAFDTADYAEAERRIAELRSSQTENTGVRLGTSRWLARLAETRGQARAAETHQRERYNELARQGRARAYIGNALTIGWLRMGLLADTVGALREVAEALDRYPLDSMPPQNRPYLDLVRFYSYAGRAEQATAAWDGYARGVPDRARNRNRATDAAAGVLAQVQGRPEESIALFRRAHDRYWDEQEFHAEMARAFDLLNEPDSALAYYQRYLETPTLDRIGDDAYWLPRVYKRLGELYEARGDRERAVEYYDKFVDLWKDADPELQPVVEDVRGRIANLVVER